jgi:hypothetical protein
VSGRLGITPLDLVTVAVLAWFGSRLFVSFRRSIRPDARRLAWEITRGLRLRHFLPVPLVVGLVLVAAIGLTRLPLLDFGWWSAIGGQGNPAFGVTDRTAGTPFEIVVPVVFLVFLVPALPLLVEREEELFRLGAEEWTVPKRIGKTVLFGLVHALIGIPIGVALALSIGGAHFLLGYLRAFRRTARRREALLESTRLHLAYNTTIVVLVVVALLVEVVLAIAA